MDLQEIPTRSWFDHPVVYQIVVKGRLDPGWADWFDGLSVMTKEDGGMVFTTLTGSVQDQGALHGLLARVRDLGLPLIDVHRLETSIQAGPSVSEKNQRSNIEKE